MLELLTETGQAFLAICYIIGVIIIAYTFYSVLRAINAWADARRIKYRHEEACYREAERRARRESKDYY